MNYFPHLGKKSCEEGKEKVAKVGVEELNQNIDQKRIFLAALESKVQRMFGRSIRAASEDQMYQAIAQVVSDLVKEQRAYSRELMGNYDGKEVYYLSMEFLMGRALSNNLINLGIEDVVAEVCHELGLELEELKEVEPDPGLGNGGLGRLAACFMDSLATLGYKATGCGIRYEYGLFQQKIIDGFQVEVSDPWLENGSNWEIALPEETELVKFGGFVEVHQEEGRLVYEHKGYQSVRAVPYEMPILGYQSDVVNALRLWAARATKHLDMSLFGQGKYLDALEEKELAEVISKVLYPDDNHPEGKALRLKQQYFFVSASVQSIVRKYKRQHGTNFDAFPEHVVIHINDTHPALAIPELMRILLDEEGLEWDVAWRITKDTFAYTNHTIMEEALERWPEGLFRDLLPRLWDIVYEINERFCASLWERYPGDWDRIARLSIIAHHEVKMAHLCIVGSFSVNGVAKLHSEILRDEVFAEFAQFYPEKFTNVTNGVTFRRFLLKANRGLAELLTDRIGSGWIKHPEELANFLPYQDDKATQEALASIRHNNKVALAKYILDHNNVRVDPHSIFDVQIKRLHEYKRQLLNILHVLYLYNRLLEDPGFEMYPRTFIFGAKAAPGYGMAKLIIKLIHDVGERINNDPAIGDKLKVVFLENYRVSLAEAIIPASDVSEQISTAGKEASGTGNMKFMLNGALTIGTMDGANVEISQAVGDENIFIFGLTAEETSQYYRDGSYRPYELYLEDPYLKQVLDQLVNGFVNAQHLALYQDLRHGLLHGWGGMADPYFVLKDFAAYRKAHEQINTQYQQPELWWKKAIVNIGSAGYFSSDRTIEEYSQRIWKLR
ncbi:MAG: glycogen/starch/alpha-glucan phosphorylase [Firmicutes bacterium]|nr:glycogen/starch/alpha-glucan phosphorylase [Bacillota bacterium]